MLICKEVCVGFYVFQLDLTFLLVCTTKDTNLLVSIYHMSVIAYEH